MINTKGVIVFTNDQKKEFKLFLNLPDDFPVFFNKRNNSNPNKLPLYTQHWGEFVYYKTNQIFKTLSLSGNDSVEITKEVIYVTTKE